MTASVVVNSRGSICRIGSIALLDLNLHFLRAFASSSFLALLVTVIVDISLTVVVFILVYKCQPLKSYGSSQQTLTILDTLLSSLVRSNAGATKLAQLLADDLFEHIIERQLRLAIQLSVGDLRLLSNIMPLSSLQQASVVDLWPHA